MSFRRWGWSLLLAVACVSAVSAAVPDDPVLVRANHMVTAPRRVLALYYGWYGIPQFSKNWIHYDKVDKTAQKIGSHLHYPSSGPYDSTDPATLERHAKEARAAGIDTLVCSWWGKGDQTDRSFRAFLPIAARSGLTLCPMYEGVTGAGKPTDLAADWSYLLAEYGKSPGWLKIDGRPVFFVYDRARRQIPVEQWADFLVKLQTDAPPGVVALAEGADLPEALIFDGLFRTSPGPYPDPAAVPPTFAATFGVQLDKARRFHRIPVVTVVPDSGGSTTPRNRRLYTAQWEEALRIPGAWVLVNSFNQWHGGTEIEPSVEYADQFLRTTAEYAARVKAGN